MSVVDCGRVASPVTAESQVRGAVVWGVGVAASLANAVHHATGRRVRRLPILLEDVL